MSIEPLPRLFKVTDKMLPTMYVAATGYDDAINKANALLDTHEVASTYTTVSLRAGYIP